MRTIPAPDGREYLVTVPGADEVPPGRAVVHNHVEPTRRLGSRGFRAWLEAPNDRLVRCDCHWAPELPAHYRIRGLGRLAASPRPAE